MDRLRFASYGLNVNMTWYPISPCFSLSEPPKRVKARHSAQG